MNSDDFEWDEDKARHNYRKHGVTFEHAKKAFTDPFMVEIADEREDYGEQRFLLMGMAEGQLLGVIYTERQGRLRIITARRATRHEQDHYFKKNSEGQA